MVRSRTPRGADAALCRRGEARSRAAEEESVAAVDPARSGWLRRVLPALKNGQLLPWWHARSLTASTCASSASGLARAFSDWRDARRGKKSTKGREEASSPVLAALLASGRTANPTGQHGAGAGAGAGSVLLPLLRWGAGGLIVVVAVPRASAPAEGGDDALVPTGREALVQLLGLSS